MLKVTSPRAGSARAIECLLGGDVDGHTIEALRAEVLSSRFHLQPQRAALFARMAWEVQHHG